MANPNKAIKMRVNNNDDSICDICKKPHKSVLDMFDLSINGTIITICDCCNDTLFYKTLKANNYTNHRLKDKHDIKIIQARNRNKSHII